MNNPGTLRKFQMTSLVSLNVSLRILSQATTLSPSSNTVMGESLLRNILAYHFEVTLNKVLKKATNESANINQSVDSIKHLDWKQKEGLFKVLKKHELLFHGRYEQ